MCILSNLLFLYFETGHPQLGQAMAWVGKTSPHSLHTSVAAVPTGLSLVSAVLPVDLGKVSTLGVPGRVKAMINNPPMKRIEPNPNFVMQASSYTFRLVCAAAF